MSKKKKQFTETQVATFVKQIDEGMLALLEENGEWMTLDAIANKLKSYDGAIYPPLEQPTKDETLLMRLVAKGVIQTMCENEQYGAIEFILDKLKQCDEGMHLRRAMSHQDAIVMADERCEIGYLLELTIEAFMKEFDDSAALEEIVRNHVGVDLSVLSQWDSKKVREDMSVMLDLPQWATKEEILKELEERL